MVYDPQARARELEREVERLKDGWQAETDRHRRLRRAYRDTPGNRGTPPKPKKRGRLDGISAKHVFSDATKSAIPGAAIFVTATGDQILESIKSGDIDIIGVLRGVSPWGEIIGTLVLGHAIMLAILKAWQ